MKRTKLVNFADVKKENVRMLFALGGCTFEHALSEMKKINEEEEAENRKVEREMEDLLMHADEKKAA